MITQGSKLSPNNGMVKREPLPRISRGILIHNIAKVKPALMPRASNMDKPMVFFGGLGLISMLVVPIP